MTSGSLSYLHFKLTESKLALWEVIITVITQNIRLSFLKTGGEKRIELLITINVRLNGVPVRETNEQKIVTDTGPNRISP